MPSSGTEQISPRFIQFAKQILSQKPVICDIGSRDAIEGIALLRQLNGATLHVFEANPQAAELCRNNLSSVGSRAVFNQVAVTDVSGELSFYPVDSNLSDNKDIGFSSLFRINPAYTRRRASIVQAEVRVTALTLNDYFANKELPELLWVDVEGAELQVFRGASSILPSVRLIHAEVSFRPMHSGKPLFPEVQSFLLAYGFSFYGFMEVPAWRAFLYRHRLLPNLPWRLNAVFFRKPAP